ncbi:MAG: hypothetical protein LLG02_17320 [Pelosinus sp.]|nr:hypothetical protein [Pelosinus sp.]
MHTEKAKILEMIQSGKITAAEGLELLEALDPSGHEATIVPEKTDRFLRIRITKGQQNKVNVNIPLSLVKVATKFAGIGMKMIPDQARLEMQNKGMDLSEINFDELAALIDQGLSDGKLVDIDTDDSPDGPTKIEIYIE